MSAVPMIATTALIRGKQNGDTPLARAPVAVDDRDGLRPTDINITRFRPSRNLSPSERMSMDEPQQIEAARKAASKGTKVKGVGSVRGNPRLCSRCLQPIGELDAWTKYISAADPPEYAVYSIIVHQRCDGLGTAANQLAASA